MLKTLLIDRRDDILELTKRRTEERVAGKPHSAKLAEGLPLFYKSLVETFENAGAPTESRVTGGHGKELFKLGYTVSQVVNAYGALCQAITEIAEQKAATIVTSDFRVLNATLDRAIAEAVSEFEAAQTETAVLADTQRVGVLVNQLRTCLETAVLAHTSMKNGLVGIGGSTNALLERNLVRMADILNAAVLDVRLRSELPPDRRPVRLIDAIGEAEIISAAEGRARDVSLSIHVDHKLEVLADRNHVISTLANLLSNAVKFSKTGGVIVVRGVDHHDTVSVEIEDQCGGLPKGKIEELFKPFTQKSADRSGVGLGLGLSRRAMELNHGSLSAEDLPGKGCVFTFTLPKPPASPVSERSPRSRRATTASRGRARRPTPARSDGRRGRRKTSARQPQRL